MFGVFWHWAAKLQKGLIVFGRLPTWRPRSDETTQQSWMWEEQLHRRPFVRFFYCKRLPFDLSQGKEICRVRLHDPRFVLCYSISYRHRSGCILCLDENETPRQRRTSWREKSSMLWISWAWRQDDSCWGPAGTPVASNNLNSCGAPGPTRPKRVVNLNCQTQKIQDWRPFAFFYSVFQLLSSEKFAAWLRQRPDIPTSTPQANLAVGSLMEQISFRPFTRQKENAAYPVGGSQLLLWVFISRMKFGTKELLRVSQPVSADICAIRFPTDIGLAAFFALTRMKPHAKEGPLEEKSLRCFGYLGPGGRMILVEAQLVLQLLQIILIPVGPQGLPGLPFGVVNLNCQTQKIRDWRPFAFFYSSISASQLWEICCRTSSQLEWELGKIGF